MSNYSEKEILVVAIKILEETGEMTTTELKEALMDEMNPGGNDLAINLNRNDTNFEQKVRNMISHRDHNELLKYCEYERFGRNGILRSKSLAQDGRGEKEKQEIETRKEKKRNFRARKVDFDEINARNKDLGLKGELYVLQHEKERLSVELGEKIIHVSVEQGDGAGYDILSYDLSGKPRYIEVKTTTGPKDTPFYLSENEKAFLEEYAEEAEIVRLYNFNCETLTGEIYRISGEDFLKKLTLQPISYKVTLK
ncbi:DUF3883 domain-containing protein [Anaerobacillus isosaccharinicus]|uniref:DUF3883 domain-containing protein n=1 Tax=Anaerobacillus isosaccharinicus TaxID=1532552 RepID=A0A1S2M7R1_9BACI|nr:DUF3883 domain-containing protein [Anaerobacillus isosaccharinicus]MBA5586750.1 DUF3883 domain-containing protein [Anaerobacillus isosaccharinicus]QOY35028.1 DUF3883 domain-containing protein [Anaerobacillus isosaccharinicus]